VGTWIASRQLSFAVNLSWLPTQASWLAQVELSLRKVPRDVLTPNDFPNTRALAKDWKHYCADLTRHPTPMQWTYTKTALRAKCGAPQPVPLAASLLRTALRLGTLLVCVIGLGVGNLLLQHRIVTQHYADIRADIARVVTELAPDKPPGQSTVHVRAKVRELEDRLCALGGFTGEQRSGLQLLRELSTRVPASLPVQVDHLTIKPETIELSGTTASYHDVAQLKAALEVSPLFPTVKIVHPKTGLDTTTIVFTLTITMAHAREAAS
jgi:type IV pilus assembly PilN-like protein